MLTEVNKVRQIRNEPTRRWFSDETMHLDADSRTRRYIPVY